MRAGTSTSLIGVPEVQQRALRAAEKKSLQVERRARDRYESRVEKGGNSQKFFKVRHARKV
jgi:pre-60S factor REI1